MLLFIARRVLYVLPIAIGVSIICFLLVHLAPGDPLSAILPDNASPDVIARIRADYGFDRPVPVQYLLWLGHVLTGDFGTSIATRRAVLSEVAPAALNTLKLALGAMLLGGGVGVLLGTLSAFRNGGGFDRSISAIGITGISVPQYWLGMVLIVIFAVDLNMLPATGMGDPSNPSISDSLRYLILPTITLSTVPAGIIARSVRSSVAEVLRQDYVQALRARGLRSPLILLHIAKNAAPPVLAIMGLQFAHLLGGSILVETVFSWPGTGFLLYSAIFMRDLPVLQGTILLLSMFFVLTNLVVDVLQMLCDPRLKSARSVKSDA